MSTAVAAVQPASLPVKPWTSWPLNEASGQLPGSLADHLCKDRLHLTGSSQRYARIGIRTNILNFKKFGFVLEITAKEFLNYHMILGIYIPVQNCTVGTYGMVCIFFSESLEKGTFRPIFLCAFHMLVLWICDILVWIRIRILLFSSVAFKIPSQISVFLSFFCLLLFQDTFTSVFKDKKKS
jgi:hypothetical protein